MAKLIGDRLDALATRGDARKLMESGRHENEPEIELTPDHPIWEAWLRLTEYYGAAFTYGDEPSATWIYNLQNLSADQIGNGIRNLAHHESAFPPNPGQFKDLCLCDYGWERRGHKVIDTSNMIENKTAKEKRKAEGLDHIHSIQDLMK
jgi:hypothetical protein